MTDVPTLQTLVDAKPPVSDDAIYVSLQRNKGNISAVAVDLDRAYSTIRKRISEHPELKELAQSLRDQILDKAEQNVFDAVDSGDLVQSNFLLRTLGANRGWTPRQEVTGKDGGAVQVVIQGDAANV
jgi:hypothetical protein